LGEKRVGEDEVPEELPFESHARKWSKEKYKEEKGHSKKSLKMSNTTNR